MDINSISDKMIKIYDSTLGLLFNFYFIIIVIILMGVFYMRNSFSLGNIQDYGIENNNPYDIEESSPSSFFGIPMFFIYIIITFAITYGTIKVVNKLFNIDIFDTIKDMITNNKHEIEVKLVNKVLDEVKDEVKVEAKQNPEVFNVSNNKYNYTDAKAVCKAYKSRLATYTEVEDSYNAGGEWCNYGWSENQMALFPTQHKTYNELQKIAGHERDCGRPGVNGGYINNTDLKYGVNCYGIKPDKTLLAEKLMQNKELYPKSKEDIELEKRAEFWKTKLDDLLVSPFNHTKWYRL
jgi:hypothetical protein